MHFSTHAKFFLRTCYINTADIRAAYACFLFIFWGTRSDSIPMPADRKPEFFKGAQLKVGIIGCGYVGLPLALRFAEAGHRVTGFDTDPAKVSRLHAGRSYI